MVLPRLKEYKTNNGYFENKLVFNINCKDSLKASKIFVLFAPAVMFDIAQNANVIFVESSEKKSGAYELCVEPSKITVIYGTYEGIRNAMSTLAQLWKEGKCPCCEIVDEPDNDFRSCMLDLARGYVEIPVLKEHIVRMALLKYNHIHLHLMDSFSYVLESDVVPNVDNRKVYTKQEMRDFIGLCKLLCLEVIPEIEIPAHANNQIRALPELGCDIIDKKKAVEIIRKLEDPKKKLYTDNKRSVSAWVVCAGNEKTYAIYEKIVEEICQTFDGKYLHIGGDELEMAILGAHPHWTNCVRCQKKMKEENIADVRRLYYYVMKRMYAIVTKFGKKMIIWNDQLDVENPIDIPKDIIVEYWRGDVITNEKYILQKLCDQGFEIINAHYPYTYVDIVRYMQEKDIKRWNTKVDFFDEPTVNGRILGGEMCAWEVGNPLYSFYSFSLPVCMVVFADRVWNHATTEYDEEYKKSVFSVVIGIETEYHPFDFFTEILPPRDPDRHTLEDIPLDKIDGDKLAFVLSSVQSLNMESVYGKLAIEAYIDLLSLIQDTVTTRTVK